MMGQNHIRTYSQMNGVDLVGIADVDEKRLSALLKQYGIEGFSDYQELLKQDLDAVSVVVPTTLHKKVGLDVINAGANLLIEKPIADSVENAIDIISAAHQEDIRLMVGHIERFNPAVMKTKEIIDSGELGNIVSISTLRVGPYNPRIRDVGVILDIGVHDVDVISYLYNSPVYEVYAIAGKKIHLFEDHASIILRFENDRAGVVETNWLTPHKTRQFTVIGTEGVAYGDYLQQKLVIHDKEWIKEAKVEKKEPLRNELECFVKACGDRAANIVSGEDGLNALMTAKASISSYKSKTAIKISSIFTRNPGDGVAEKASV
ncbi:putative oxidoreductase [Methanocella paludicola SANAE]|uniref:Oxidoreductase n=1 Tax=Methanocella paludicola (strain DSM 17711 / JCM 13418 / NBRC 101707 / SANAE) TaxID=304371 RepID=D1YWL5_METPS|nr:UDP-N-acetylglucosamine 3-dehydrogenase [Methanocella paludicola]BAI60837.1 putative oxidoreductase [Methanocella paludicola SANAE]